MEKVEKVGFLPVNRYRAYARARAREGVNRDLKSTFSTHNCVFPLTIGFVSLKTGGFGWKTGWIWGFLGGKSGL